MRDVPAESRMPHGRMRRPTDKRRATSAVQDEDADPPASLTTLSHASEHVPPKNGKIALVLTERYDV